MSMIRQAKLQDANEIQRIYNEEILHGTATFDTEIITDEGCRQRMREHMQHPFFVFEDKNEVIGFAGLSSFNKKPAYDQTKEVTIYIASAHQGKGVGSKLFSHLLQAVRKEGQLRTLISLITANNEGSIRLHQKLGFTYVGTMKDVGYKFDQYLDVSIYQFVL